MKRSLLAVVAVLSACGADAVSVVLERGTVCDPGPTNCRLVDLPDDAGRELIVYRASATTLCDETLLRRAAALEASDADRVTAQSFRGARGAPIGELDPRRYAFVALVRSAAASCPVGWWGCSVVSLDDAVSEIEIAIEERAGGSAITGCGSDRACVPEEGRCE